MVYTAGVDPIATNEHLRRNTHIIIGAQFLLGPGTKDAKGESYDGFDPESVYYSNNLFDSEGLMIGKAPDNTNIDASCKLYMNDIFWSETAYKAYVVEYLGYLLLDDKIKNELEALVENGKYNDGVIYVSSESNATEPGPATGTYFELGHVKMEKGDNMVYVKPNEEVYLYIKNTAWDPEKEATWEDDKGVVHNNNKEFIQLPKVKGRDFFEKIVFETAGIFCTAFQIRKNVLCNPYQS